MPAVCLQTAPHHGANLTQNPPLHSANAPSQPAHPPEAGLLPSTRLALSSAALSSSSSRALWSTWVEETEGERVLHYSMTALEAAVHVKSSSQPQQMGSCPSDQGYNPNTTPATQRQLTSETSSPGSSKTRVRSGLRVGPATVAPAQHVEAWVF